MLRILLSLAASFCLIPPLFGQLKPPGEFLPHEYGQQFTPHYLLVDYVEHVAENSAQAQLRQYGSTPEGRPLLLAFISTPENLAQLEDIRRNNLQHAGLMDGEPDGSLDKAIVWLSFGVHGNEAGASEASLSVLYELARPGNEEARAWLANTIVILDPCINPDGFSRYTEWYRRYATLKPAPDPGTYEHEEPWPGGRVNHYLFDLNRDWAWQTQTETQNRVRVYQEWMPHIHVDFHEQYPDDHYYFAPAAPPFHQYITGWQSEFQYDIGRNHARYFDQEGWLYFTREVFDLLYPSYGDTYPTFNGAIGMTHEQAGHGIAGRAYEMENGDTLTLLDRIQHHTATALSTVEVASENAGRLVENFNDYFTQGSNGPIGKYKTFIIRGDNPQGRLGAFREILDKNGIRYGEAGAAGSLRAYNYQSGQEETILVQPEDLLISTYQPMSVLAQVLLEPEPELEDTLTYDITAWALPYAYGLKAYASRERMEPASPVKAVPYANTLENIRQPYAYLSEWSSMADARFLAALLQNGIKARFATGPFTVDGRQYEAGTLVFTLADNRKMGAIRFDELMASTAREFEQPVYPITTGFSDYGFDLGSSSFKFIEPPRVAVVTGEETSAGSYGEIWYFFEQALRYPLYPIAMSQLSDVPYSDYNVLVLPEGEYEIDEAGIASLAAWIERGGRLIAIGAALSALEGQEGFNLAAAEEEEPDTGAIGADRRLEPYASQPRRELSQSIPGAIFHLQLDHTHPLAYGLDTYHSLKTSSKSYPLLKEGWNVGYIGETPEVAGFAGWEALEKTKNSVVFAVEDKGKGAAVYMVDNPLFRGFWENGKFLFSNALFFAGQ
ncbi:MAG: zinc carboxypeptidase [Lewinellaceae bacterium]|nr:zinc carboxypeptidase [Phaeodactylibacter sp.]MCB9040253.1 zinc carboxypeptidase [Lewinellaceae bacterium]